MIAPGVFRWNFNRLRGDLSTAFLNRVVTLAIMVRTTSQSSSQTLSHSSLQLPLVFGLPATTVLGRLRCNPQIFDRASCGGHSGGCPSSAPAQLWWGLAVISDHGSTALLRSRHKLGTALRTFLTLVALPPSFLTTLMTNEEATPYFLQSFLAVMPTLLLAAFAIRSLACSVRKLRGRRSTLSNSLSAPSPLHDLHNAINGPSWDPFCHKVSNGVCFPFLQVLLIKLSKHILSQFQWKNLHHLHFMQSSSHCLTDWLPWCKETMANLMKI